MDVLVPPPPPRPDGVSDRPLVASWAAAVHTGTQPVSMEQLPATGPTGWRRFQRPAIKTAGVLLVLFGIGLMGAIEKAQERMGPWASKTEITTVQGIEGALGLGMVVAGVFLFRRGWKPGYTVQKTLSGVVAGVFVVLLAIGLASEASHRSSSPPTDAFGYTAAEKQAFVDGCGGGQVCLCLMGEVERAIPLDKFIEDSLAYQRTGEMPADFQQVIENSGC